MWCASTWAVGRPRCCPPHQLSKVRLTRHPPSWKSCFSQDPRALRNCGSEINRYSFLATRELGPQAAEAGGAGRQSTVTCERYKGKPL